MTAEKLRARIEGNPGKVMRLFKEEDDKLGSFFPIFEITGEGNLKVRDHTGSYNLSLAEIHKIEFLDVMEICRLLGYAIRGMRHISEKEENLSEEIKSAALALL